MAKTSKRTEEEMLQETFAQFQAQATTEDAATESGGAAPGAVKSGNKNNLILLGTCVAAAGILGYIFLLKPMLNPEVQQQSQAPATQVAAVNPEPQVQQPVVQVPVAPVAPIAPIAPPVAEPVVSALDPIAQLQAQAQSAQMPVPTPVAPIIAPDVVKTPEVDKFFAQGQNPGNGGLSAPIAAPTPVAASPIVNPVVVDPVAPIVPVAPAVPVVADITPVAPIVPVTGLDAQQTNVVAELQSRFESQNNEFKNLISSVDGRVTNVEEKIVAHDARITRLESFHDGQKAKVKTVEKKAENTSAKGNGEGSEVKAVAASEKAKAVVKKVRPVVKPKEEAVQDENVLFGSASTVKKKEAPKKAEKPVYQEYPIHSIYGGRFWLKNSDGSLSTYAAGDRLPSGEVVKEVNDEEFSIKTNLRTIVKR